MVQLIVSDLDGTLLGADGEVDEAFFELLPKMKQRGIHFVVATGRQISSAKERFIKAGAFLDDIFFITQNGSCVEKCGRVLTCCPLEKSIVQDAVVTVEKSLPGVLPILFSPEIGYISAQKVDTLKLLKREKVYCQTTESLEMIAQTTDIVRFTVRDPGRVASNSFPLLYEKYSRCTSVTVATETWMDMVSGGVHKGAALKDLQTMLGVCVDETMVFGDYYNDLTMLQQGKYSFAVDNACDDAKKIAKYRCASHWEKGVVNTLERFLHMNENDFWRHQYEKNTQ